MNSPELALQRVKACIEDGYTHPLYGETQEILKASKEIHADDSEDQKDQLRRYRMSEDSDLFKQRVRISNPATAAPLETCYSYISQVWRTDGVKKTLTINSEAAKRIIEEQFGTFYGRMDLHEYMFTQVQRANVYDPNAWMIFERSTLADNTGRVMDIEFYPIYVNSTSAIDWGFDRKGNTQYLLFRQSRTVYQGKAPREIWDYYVYGQNYYLHVAEQLDTDSTDMRDFSQYAVAPIKPERGRRWLYFTAPLPGNICPAFRLGAYPYKEHPEICELFAQNAVPALQDLMRDANYLAVMKTLHCFPDRAEYVKPCKHENEQGECCEGGWYGGVRNADHRCQSCGGLGYATTVSEQTTKRLPWPDNADELVELQKLSHYFERPIGIVETYISETERITRHIVQIVMNQETFERPQAIKTAAEILVNYDKIYNKLMPFAEQVAAGWEYGIIVGLSYLAADGDAEMRYPADMKMMTINELLIQLGAAKTNGAPIEVIDGINTDLIQKQYRAMPDVAADVAALQSWKPWRDKTDAQVAAIIGQRSTADFQRRLWENFTEITAYIGRTMPAGQFAKTAFEGQRDIINKALDAVTEGQENARQTEPVDLLKL
jgi:hypothetical protein